MDTNLEKTLKTNQAYIYGRIISDPVKENFKRSRQGTEEVAFQIVSFKVSVERLSGASDILEVNLPQSLYSLYPDLLRNGKSASFYGQIRTRNFIDKYGKSHLYIYFWALEVSEEKLSALINNQVWLLGYVCKPPVYRITPFNREICDLLLATNRSGGKSSYIPTILWGRNARFAERLPIASTLVLKGRMQSREFQKEGPNGVETRIARELSVSFITLIKENEDPEIGDLKSWLEEQE